MLVDADRVFFTERSMSAEKKIINILSINEEKTSEANLLAASQLIRSWLAEMRIEDEECSGTKAWRPDFTPPILLIGGIDAIYQDMVDINTTEGSPISVR